MVSVGNNYSLNTKNARAGVEDEKDNMFNDGDDELCVVWVR